ncbi:Protein trichome birefringence [Rhynchospora pubera]|uniref:Protein trichome birefringence n=1 Tax=Rhynchospora pubera TaxID=906938 RepID=A0AAV8DQC4_9POAL|nr:Protein trichome birefringence [Rhynchospora pubera]
MGSELQVQPWPGLNRKSNQAWIKLLLLVLLAGVAFRFFVSSSNLGSVLPDYVRQAFLGGAHLSEPSSLESGSEKDLDVEEIDFGDQRTSDAQKDFLQEGRCNLFTGEWVHDPAGPMYTNETCRFIESPQNCMTNGRPDREYLYWKWKPYGCELPAFDAEKFLDSMRNKSWALIGDSILRNHVQSMLCLLSRIEDPEEVYHDETFKSRRWHFKSHNFTLSLIWSPFLIKADVFENDDGVSTADIELHLDILDKNWTGLYQNFDYVVISTGQWFLKTAIYWDSGKMIGCHYCKGRNLTEVTAGYAFRRALQEVFQFINSSPHRPLVFYRTWTPDHFENGEWWSGGNCNRTKPYKKGDYDGKNIDHLMRKIEIDEFKDAIRLGGSPMRLLDTFDLSVLRPDGHSGPYRTFHPFDEQGRRKPNVVNDCLHWCLPGPIDAWNDILMQMSTTST